GDSRCRGAGESGLSFDGASLEHDIDSNSAAWPDLVRNAGRNVTMRSPRPGVSPSCPEHDGLTSPSGAAVARTRAGDMTRRAADQRTQFGLAGASSTTFRGS